MRVSLESDDYALIAIDQKIDQVMKQLVSKNQTMEMDILLGLGYLLDFYGMDFEEIQKTNKLAE